VEYAEGPETQCFRAFQLVAGAGFEPATFGSYDLVMAFEMIHDLTRPVEALTTMRRLGKPDAVHLVMDEKVAETFEAPTENPVERLMYAASVLHCLPVGRADSPSTRDRQGNAPLHV
jgi:2-polyprenyl-3-methyl-5-hydroxy-6-metoxy-1,4-benzoquinol methylase